MYRQRFSSIKHIKQSFEPFLSENLKFHQYAGLSLSGGKSNKTSYAIVQFYPKQKKIFLTDLHYKLQSIKEKTADELLIESFKPYGSKLKAIAVDAPLSLPKCIRCKLKCPGYAKCRVSEVVWMRNEYAKNNKQKKPKNILNPYIERSAEVYISKNLEEPFFPPHAMGANNAPMAARMNYLSKHIKHKKIEFFPKLSLWRIGKSLGIRKSYLRFHKNSADGHEIREIILKRLIEKDIAFIYVDDLKKMIKSPQAFDAFIGALTAVLYGTKQVESKPKGYPKSSSWIEIPKRCQALFL